MQSELIANEQLPESGGDPRVAAALENPLIDEYHNADGTAVVLVTPRGAVKLRIGAIMDHLFDMRPKPQVESRSYANGGLVTVATVLKPGQKLRVIKLVGYGWSAERSLEAVRDQVYAAVSAARADRLGRAARRAAPVSRRLLDPGRRRGGRGRRGAAGGALRAVPRAAGRGEGGEPGDPGQGADRARVRRARVLGHRVVRAAGAHVYRPGRRRARAELAAQHASAGHRAGHPAGPEGRGLPVADDRGPGVLRLLAGGHRRLPRQRGHRRRRGPVRRRDRRRGVQRGPRHGTAHADRAAVALPGPSRRPGAVPHRRGHRA